MGIVNPTMLEIYDDIHKDPIKHVEDVLLNRRDDATERLLDFAQTVSNDKQKEEKIIEWRGLDLQERISHSLIKGIDTYIDEEELQVCDKKICEIADALEPRSYTSREFINEMGKYLKKNSVKKDSLIETAYDNDVPIFCPAFTDSSAGFGLVMHQEKNPKKHITIDSVREFRELTEIKIQSKGSGLFMIGGGVPKNFIQDTVICAELLGKEVDMHKYAIQITVADSRDGACSSSTLKEASSWGKVDVTKEQMVFAEATSVLPLIASDAYHKGEWKNRDRKNFSKIFK